MLSIAVTGANGYIGRHVVTALCDMGACVYALDLCVEGGDPRARWMQVDVFDPSFAPAELFDEMPDVCLHLAWRNGFDHNAPTHMGDLSGHYLFFAQDDRRRRWPCCRHGLHA